MDAVGDWEKLSDKAEYLLYSLEDTNQISSSYWQKQLRSWLFEYDNLKYKYTSNRRSSARITGPGWSEEIAEQKS